ncbi:MULTISPECIES: branched-chain amino acid ABC transporter permease [Prauserella salsuginis group]|uniref:Branched-chain amino acid transport system permease protein n=2 Tax=Prauserella salsuginis group TaxID=2893672 RepID=A0A839XVV3_9PSEU|nr:MULTISPECIES: branched-chain amino acid ABC transporter permease [Prauserella salsuginis group]MBB3664653.1 branched-chain amino acid transport system permease protein [Prauserella sediminis]MCR3722120.1 amino acid/amide ABC transporter membrane protein 1, HAAT family [Prauserella flava]MCR3736117.1 amino acid/amide ABC transporter membrane protein 1, HAAT family [Prauserella salsuginis]
MTLFIQQLFDGLALGGVYCLAAIGLTLIFGVLRIPNLAHGTLYMLGAYVTYFFLVTVGVPYVAAIGLAAVVLAVIGVLLERIVFHPLRNAPHTHHMIAAVGAMFFFQAVAQAIWGADFRRMESPISGSVTILGAQISWQRIVIVVTAVIVLGLLTWFIKRSIHGQTIEAIEQDRTGSSLVGISPSRVSMLTFGLAAALATVAAGLVAPINLLAPTMGDALSLKVFAIIILGGLGSLPGAIVGGFTLALAEVMTSTYVSAAAGEGIAFVVIVLVLAIRPTGLFARAVQR